jgi:hypothetical protein
LKEVFKGAAHLVATQMTDHPLHQDYQRLIDGGMRPNLAQLTIARRLAAAVLAMWKHEEAYDPERHRTHLAQARDRRRAASGSPAQRSRHTTGSRESIQLRYGRADAPHRSC